MEQTLAGLLFTVFATNQNYYAEQQSDGTYRKKPGIVTPKFLVTNIDKCGSIAIYQKNTDHTVKWVCLDFDIVNKHKGADTFKTASNELNRVVKYYCKALDLLGIPHLLEFSGNRGFHIWVTFDEATSFRVGYDIVQAIIDKVDCKYNPEYIGLDLFPASRTPTDNVGIGVKIPVSKHTKSSKYSLLINSVDDVKSLDVCKLSVEVLSAQVEILNSHTSTNKSKIEGILGVFFDLSHDETFDAARIRSIKVQNNGFTLKTLVEHWSKYEPLRVIADRVTVKKELNNTERKLLVGMFSNVYCKHTSDFNHSLLHEIFKNTKNYKYEITKNAIRALSSFYFPSQEQIEKTAGVKFKETYNISELLSVCIPTYVEHVDATLNLSAKDIDIARIAELNYLFSNDEAQSKIVINELTSVDSEELLFYVNRLIQYPQKAKFYLHVRNESIKQRVLTSLKTVERVATSSILKQIIYLLDFRANPNSLGYRPNKGFRQGHIFQPWLYLWIEFISNINSAIEDKNNATYYIVKTDIKSFYDKIPHDNLKRMLLGGVNPRIDEKVGKLSDETASLYKIYIDALFDLTRQVTGTNVGMPQGPAYARFLAELYLDNIDCLLSGQNGVNKLYLYQRYVDDIFFIAPTEEIANNTLDTLKKELEYLGLEINTKKTIISQISNFGKEFEEYRSQSKYAIDRVSKNIDDATEAQRDLAINEFFALVHSESCENDLAFIYSHLSGISQLDSWKRDRVVPTINSKVGRGTLYKHLFNFVLEDSQNWSLLSEIDTFSELQSEVLTASLIYAIEANRSKINQLNTLIELIAPKLTLTELVGENLAYLIIMYGTSVDIHSVSPMSFIDCINSVENVENLHITHDIMVYLNTSLNDIKSLASFVKIMYPLCSTSQLPREDLNDLASTFYAKIASDLASGDLAIDKKTEISCLSTSAKFYYLICLFSLSNKNNSTELLKEMWKYCTHLFNMFGDQTNFRISSNWFKKMDDLDIDDKKAQLVITSIVDGTIFRGPIDKCKVFEKFHNLILIYITFQKYDIFNKDIDSALDMLKEKAVFYKWLTERGSTKLFPYTKPAWFEKNLVENGVILLKNGSQVLVRRPTEDFHDTSTPINEHNGYSEILEPYFPDQLQSLKATLAGKTVKEILNSFIDVVNICGDAFQFPNIFLNDSILKTGSLLPFTSELLTSNSLIFEDYNDTVEPFKNNIVNFARCFFRTKAHESDGMHFKQLYEKYLLNISPDMDLLALLTQICSQLDEVDNIETEFFFDVVIASSLYSVLYNMDPIQRIDKFVNQYHVFNKQNVDRHIYGVTSDFEPSDKTLSQLFASVEHSLRIIRSEVLQSLVFYLDSDIVIFKNNLMHVVNSIDDAANTSLGDFYKATHRIYQTREVVTIDGVEYKFSQVNLLNAVSREMHKFEYRHSALLNSSEHLYVHHSKGNAYLIALNSSITKIYQSIFRRYTDLGSNHSSKSFPEMLSKESDLLNIDNFYAAADNISIHRDIVINDARQLLVKWLLLLPKKFHGPFVSILSAHVVMKNEEIFQFIHTVQRLISDPLSNPFLVKHVKDYNGTHRILYKNASIGRKVESFSPANISDDATIATIITDNIITGTQIIDAIKFYLTGESTLTSPNYFEFDILDSERLKKLSAINICTILYTKNAIVNIEAFFKTNLNPDITVNVINGRDVGVDAFFGSTSKIGEQDKKIIRDLLRDDDSMHILHNVLEPGIRFKFLKYNSNTDIDSTNVIARYQSLPKKCFRFLYAGLKHDSECHPFIRILEAGES
jgi:hypothetical protein